MTGAIVISWGSPVRGREGKGLETFGKALAYYEGLAKQGRVHAHREYFAITGNHGKLSGFMIVEGQLDELLRIQTEEDSLRLMAEAATIVDNFAVRVYAGGSDRTVQEQVTRYTETMTEMGVL